MRSSIAETRVPRGLVSGISWGTSARQRGPPGWSTSSPVTTARSHLIAATALRQTGEGVDLRQTRQLACSACGSDQFAPISTVGDGRSDSNRACGLVLVNPAPSFRATDRFSEMSRARSSTRGTCTSPSARRSSTSSASCSSPMPRSWRSLDALPESWPGRAFMRTLQRPVLVQVAVASVAGDGTRRRRDPGGDGVLQLVPGATSGHVTAVPKGGCLLGAGDPQRRRGIDL